MSGVPLESYNIDSIPPRPEHHLHNTNERLPGAQGGAPTIDYSAETMNHTPNAALGGQSTLHRDTHHTTPRDSATHHSTSHTGLDSNKPPMTRTDSAKGKTAFDEERPLGVKPTPAGKPTLPSRP